MLYEKKAAAYLSAKGYRILERNYRCKAGEIDLIVEDGAYLVFVEVKYRTDLRAGYGFESVGIKKQHTIRKSALWYLTEKHVPSDRPCRFDVISFLAEEITLIKDAF